MSTLVHENPRDRLLAAAETRFRRFGYKRTTIEDVATEAGTGKGSVYLHFDSKRDVYMAVVERSLDRFIDGAERLVARPGTSLLSVPTATFVNKFDSLFILDLLKGVNLKCKLFYFIFFLPFFAGPAFLR